MMEIQKEEAIRLRNSGEIGFWALWVNPVVVHPSGRYVIHVANRWFVVEPDEFRLEPQGITRMPVPKHLRGKGVVGKIKQVHAVITSEEINALIRHDSSRAKPIDLGVGIPTVHGDYLKPKDE